MYLFHSQYIRGFTWDAEKWSAYPALSRHLLVAGFDRKFRPTGQTAGTARRHALLPGPDTVNYGYSPLSGPDAEPLLVNRV